LDVGDKGGGGGSQILGKTMGAEDVLCFEIATHEVWNLVSSFVRFFEEQSALIDSLAK
jgi:hypothetical protein